MNYLPQNFGSVCVTSPKIVYPQGIAFSQQGVIFRVPISNIYTLSTKRTSYWVNQNFLHRFCLFFVS